MTRICRMLAQRFPVEQRTALWLLFALVAVGVDSAHGQTLLPVDGVVAGSISAVGEADEYVFYAAAGEPVHIRVASDGTTNLRPRVYLYNPDGTRFFSGTSTSMYEVACYTTSSFCKLTQSGAYRLVVEDFEGDGHDLGDYHVHFVRPMHSNKGGLLPNDASVSGDVAYAEFDTYTFQANAGEPVHIKVVRTEPSYFTPRFWLYGPDGSLVFSSLGTGGRAHCHSTSSTCKITLTGTHRLVVADSTGKYAGAYVVNLARVLQPSENGALVNDGVVSGRITPGDLDTFTFQASAGEAVHVQVVETEEGRSGPKIWLYNPDGTLLPLVYDSSGSSLIDVVAANCHSTSSVCKLTQTGAYRLVVEDRGISDEIGYRIHFARVRQANEHGALADDGSVDGELTLGDIDTFTFQAAAGGSLYLRVGNETAPYFNPKIWLYGPNGVLVFSGSARGAIDVDCYPTSSSCRLEQTGIYRLVVKEADDAFAGAYEVLHQTSRLLAADIVQDSVWSDASLPYRVHGTIRIAPGVTLKVRKGVRVGGGKIQVFGTLDARGTGYSPVIFRDIAVEPGANASTQSTPFRIALRHVDFAGALYEATGQPVYGSLSLLDSSVRLGGRTMHLWYPVENVHIERNLLHGAGISVGTSSAEATIANNHFSVSRGEVPADPLIENWAAEGAPTRVEGNSFWAGFGKPLVALRPGSDSAALVAKRNWWGTDDPKEIRWMVRDALDDPAIAGLVPFKPVLSGPHPETPTPQFPPGRRPHASLAPIGQHDGEPGSGVSVALWNSASNQYGLHLIHDLASTDQPTPHDLTSAPLAGQIAIGDADGNGTDDVAWIELLPEEAVRATVLDTGTGAVLRRSKLLAGYHPLHARVIPPHSSHPRPLLVVLGVSKEGNVRAQVKDALTGTWFSNVPFASASEPFGMEILGDRNGNGHPEIAVVGVDASGRVRAQVRDAATGEALGWLKFPSAFAPSHAAGVDTDADGWSDAIAVLGEHEAEGVRARVMRLGDAEPVGEVRFERGFSQAGLVSFRSAAAEPGPLLAVLERSNGGTTRVQVKGIFSSAANRVLELEGGHFPRDFRVLPGSAGAPASRLGYLAQALDGTYLLQVVDPETGAELHRVGF